MTENRGAGSAPEGDEESMSTGRMGQRNRNTPGRTKSELGIEDGEARGHNVVGGSSLPAEQRSGATDAEIGASATAPGRDAAPRKNPPLVEDAGTGDGGLSASGGVAADRGHGGASDAGAGGPLGDMRSGPAQHQSTSRGDLDHGTIDEATARRNRDGDRRTGR